MHLVLNSVACIIILSTYSYLCVLLCLVATSSSEVGFTFTVVVYVSHDSHMILIRDPQSGFYSYRLPPRCSLVICSLCPFLVSIV